MLEGFFVRIVLFDDRETHVLRRSFDLAHGCFDGVAVQIRHFLFCDFADLFLGDLADFFRQRLGGTFGDSCGLLEHLRNRSDLEDEIVSAILIHRDDAGDDLAATIRRCVVELFAKFSDVQTLRAERRTDRRGRVGCASHDLQLNVCFYFLGHNVGLVDGDTNDEKRIIREPSAS